ncbi:MAG: hypothetical protein WC498_02395 [Candidatus Saccharimonadales bacterium]
MDIEGNNGLLDPDEQRATGYPESILLTQIDVPDLLDDVYSRISSLEHMKAADDDELTHCQRASIGPEMIWQLRRLQLIGAMAERILEHECEEYLKKHPGKS